MTGPTCPHCGQSLGRVEDGPETFDHCPICNLSFAVGQTWGGSGPAPEIAGGDSPRPSELSPLLELPSLQRNIENDEAARRTRAIHRVFWRVTLGVWLVCFVGCVNMMSDGKGEQGFTTFVAGLFGGPLVGAIVAFFFAVHIKPDWEVSGAEELRKRSRKARRLAREAPSAQGDGPESVAAPPRDAPPAQPDGIVRNPEPQPPHRTEGHFLPPRPDT